MHQVRHSALNVMFHPDFQQRYTGQEYNASFEFSRSQLRQLHRAVETALARLGAGVLFPTAAAARLPQVLARGRAGEGDDGMVRVPGWCWLRRGVYWVVCWFGKWVKGSGVSDLGVAFLMGTDGH